MYRLLRPLLFALDAERSHEVTLRAVNQLFRIPGAAALIRRHYRPPALPTTVMGLQFPNPVGLAAGLDKNARYLAPLFSLGFGWLELGTVTPRPQPGNAKKRLFRLAQAGAIINRMGFNNVGVARFIDNLRRQHKPGIVGINIGKNRDTPLERAIDDYVLGLRAVAAHADYVCINISSPNTAQLRELQAEAQLDGLLHALKAEQTQLQLQYGRYVPIALKVAPDLHEDEVASIARLLLHYRFDAVIATNTTVTRPDLGQVAHAREAGGLSGRPLRPLATQCVANLYRHLQGEIPIIGVGGIDSVEAAWEKMLAGADLVQVYTGLIFSGPHLVKELVTGLLARTQPHANLTEAIRASRLNLLSAHGTNWEK